jgi:hypothetical protein
MVRAISGVIVLIVVFGLFVSAAAAAEEVKCEGAIVRIEGEIVAVKDGMNERVMKVEPGTQITSAGKPVMVSDLKVGQKVKCVCDQRGGEMICTAMELMRDTP